MQYEGLQHKGRFKEQRHCRLTTGWRAFVKDKEIQIGRLAGSGERCRSVCSKGWCRRAFVKEKEIQIGRFAGSGERCRSFCSRGWCRFAGKDSGI